MIHEFFGWPNGGVWSNEVAAVLWIPVAAGVGWWVRRELKKIHARFDKIHEHLEQTKPRR